MANDSETVNITQTVADGSKIIDNFSATEHGGGFRSDGILNITGSNGDANWFSGKLCVEQKIPNLNSCRHPARRTSRSGGGRA